MYFITISIAIFVKLRSQYFCRRQIKISFGVDGDSSVFLILLPIYSGDSMISVCSTKAVDYNPYKEITL